MITRTGTAVSVASPLLILLCAVATTPVLCGGIAVLETIVEDNGDGDGYADTRETIALRLKLQNTTGADLTDVTLHLSSDDYALACLTDTTLHVGDMVAGEIVETTEAFEFFVADVDRAAQSLDPWDDLSVGFQPRAATQARSASLSSSRSPSEAISLMGMAGAPGSSSKSSRWRRVVSSVIALAGMENPDAS